MIKNHVKQRYGRKRKWEKKGLDAEKAMHEMHVVLSGIHMSLNTGWQSVWCFPIFHYQAASPAARHYLLMTEWTADLMDRWMGSLMNVWQVLCQSGRQSKTQGEGRNHLDSRDTSNVSYTTQNPTCPRLSQAPACNQITALHLALMRLLYCSFVTYNGRLCRSNISWV